MRVTIWTTRMAKRRAERIAAGDASRRRSRTSGKTATSVALPRAQP
jgi:hypothetical protein